MEPKAPVLLIVLVETSRLRWFAAGLGMDGEVMPLVCSEEGDLDKYLGLEFDEQLSFLRHRLSGVLQRGCDRLWARMKKPRQLVFLLESPLTHATAELTPRVAEHFVEWMTSPPVAFFMSEHGFAPDPPFGLNLIAGELDQPLRDLLSSRLPELFAAAADASRWEISKKKVSS